MITHAPVGEGALLYRTLTYFNNNLIVYPSSPDFSEGIAMREIGRRIIYSGHELKSYPETKKHIE